MTPINLFEFWAPTFLQIENPYCVISAFVCSKNVDVNKCAKKGKTVLNVVTVSFGSAAKHERNFKFWVSTQELNRLTWEIFNQSQNQYLRRQIVFVCFVWHFISSTSDAAVGLNWIHVDLNYNFPCLMKSSKFGLSQEEPLQTLVKTSKLG